MQGFVLVASVVILAGPAGCKSFADYSRPRGDGRAAPRDASPDAPRDASPDAPRDASPDAPRDASPDAPRDALPDAPRDALPDAPRDALPDAPPPCGRAVEGSKTLIDFSCPETLGDFDFLYTEAAPIFEPGPGTWTWAPSGTLVSVGNVRAFPNGRVSDGGPWREPKIGTLALYGKLAPDGSIPSAANIADGSVSVHVVTTDGSATVALVARVQDALHLYRFGVNYPEGSRAWFLDRRANDSSVVLGEGGHDDPDADGGSWGTSGLRLTLTFVGNRITPYIDGVSLGTFFDDGLVSGRVGIEAMSMSDGAFDNMEIVRGVPTPGE